MVEVSEWDAFVLEIKELVKEMKISAKDIKEQDMALLKKNIKQNIKGMKSISDKDLAWFAGLLDGEGCIGVSKRAGVNFPRYSLSVQIKMTHKPTIERVLEVAGVGSIRKDVRDDIKVRTCWAWSISGKKAFEFLTKVAPSLYTKKNEAYIAMQFWEYMNKTRGKKRKVPESVGNTRESFYQTLKLLKRHEYKE